MPSAVSAETLGPGSALFEQLIAEAHAADVELMSARANASLFCDRLTWKRALQTVLDAGRADALPDAFWTVRRELGTGDEHVLDAAMHATVAAVCVDTLPEADLFALRLPWLATYAS